MKLTTCTVSWLSATATILSLMLPASVLPSARGDLLAYDGFNYGAGSNVAGQGGSTPWPSTTNWTGVSGTVAIIENETMPYSGLLESGLIMETTSSNAGVFRNLGQSYNTSSNIWWFSALMRIDVGSGSSYAGVSLYEGTSERFFFGQRIVSNTWGIERSGSTGVSSLVSTIGQAIGFLVVKLDGNANTASLYVNPTSLGGNAPDSPTVSFTLASNFAFNRFRIQTGSSEMLDVDELRFGTSYADVTPRAVVPEPSSMALIGVGATMLAVLAWRRKKSVASDRLAVAV